MTPSDIMEYNRRQAKKERRLPRTWVAHAKGGFSSSSGGWEVSVLRKNNLGGKDSYGWCGENKILISSNSFYDSDKMPPKAIRKRVFESLVALAKQVAEELNQQEAQTK